MSWTRGILGPADLEGEPVSAQGEEKLADSKGWAASCGCQSPVCWGCCFGWEFSFCDILGSVTLRGCESKNTYYTNGRDYLHTVTHLILITALWYQYFDYLHFKVRELRHRETHTAQEWWSCDLNSARVAPGPTRYCPVCRFHLCCVHSIALSIPKAWLKSLFGEGMSELMHTQAYLREIVSCVPDHHSKASGNCSAVGVSCLQFVNKKNATSVNCNKTRYAFMPLECSCYFPDGSQVWEPLKTN